MFQSTTIRLTGWYLLILISLSIMFSIIIYQLASSEIQTRLEGFQTSLQASQDIEPTLLATTALRADESAKTKANLSVGLLYINLMILLIGGLGSYFLARRSLLPIQKAHEAESRFTSDASHELRTPLAVIKTEIEVALRDNNANIDDLKEVLASNLEEVDKLSKLAEMLLSLSRLDHSKLKLSPVNLYKISHNVIKSLKLPSNRISLICKKQLTVCGDEIAIFELIKVLIDNSVQYSPNDSVINIAISESDINAKFEISNTGPGIQPDKLPFIFERFYRADSSRTNGQHKGYGLGLALAKSIVELHSGELIASSAPNQETTFTVLLPLTSRICKTKDENITT